MPIVVRSSSIVCAWLLVTGLASAFAPTPAAAQEPDASARAARQFTLGLEDYKAFRFPMALDTMRRVLEIDKTHRDARLLAGDCYVKLGRYEEAIELLEPFAAEYADDRTLASPPLLSAAHPSRGPAGAGPSVFAYVLATAYIETDRPDQSRPLIDRVLGAGDSAEGYVLLAMTRMRAGDMTAALAELKKAEAIDPRFPLVHALMGRALLRGGHRSAALAAFRKELAINPNDFDANLQIGQMKVRERQLDAARVYIHRAMETRWHDVVARFTMARIYAASGQPDEARVLLKWVLKDDPTHAEALTLFQALGGLPPR